MKILIAAREQFRKKENYTNALDAVGLDWEICLSPASVSDYDGLLLPGGCDVDPIFYGEENTASDRIDTELDKAQMPIIKAFAAAKKPILGICRGTQILNVCFGGNLYQNLDAADRHRHIDSDQRHPCVCAPGSAAEKIFGPATVTNSAHHQGCRRIASGFKQTMTSSDGVAEAIEHESLPILGVQFHPERMTGEYLSDQTADGKLVFEYFRKMCEDNR